jgi:ATP:ADP antiporter, AAA family
MARHARSARSVSSIPKRTATPATAAATAAPPARGPIGSVLNLFTDVRSGELTTALLLMTNLFLLLASYYLLKTIREPLILTGTGGGADVKSYSAAATAGLLIVLVPLYSALANRVSRVTLINSVTLFFISNLVIFFILSGAGIRIGVPFFIWVGIFNLVIIAQVWAFANDVYTVEQGKRLFAIVGFGASMGAIAGSFFTGKLVEHFGPYPFMIAAAVLLGLSMVITNLVHRRERDAAAAGERKEQKKEQEDVAPDQGKESRSGFALVFTNRYLLLIALLMVILNLVNTTGEYILGQTVSKLAESRAGQGGLKAEGIIGSFYGNYFTWVNVVSAIIQAFIVSRVIKHFGVRAAILVLPLVALTGYVTLAFLPVLGIIKTVKVAENSLDYSLQNTTRNALYLPTSRAEKYKAKQANDTFFVRFGDVLSAGLVFAGLHWLSLSLRGFALVNAALVLVWIVIAIAIGRRFASLTRESGVDPAAAGR